MCKSCELEMSDRDSRPNRILVTQDREDGLWQVVLPYGEYDFISAWRWTETWEEAMSLADAWIKVMRKRDRILKEYGL